MKKLYILIVAMLLINISYGQTVFINELHYDNAGSDVDEAVEIAGPAGTDLSNYSLVAYNGNDGGEYSSIALSGTISDQDDGYGTLHFLFSGLQNGAPDGIALVNDGTTIQFLSYEGSFTATDGPANGMTSLDIGVAEIGTPEGESLQLSGAGTDYTNFTWQESMTNTMGAINTGQDFGGVPMPSISISSPTEGSALNPEFGITTNLTFIVANFDVDVTSGDGDGHIHYTIDGGSTVMIYTTDPITLTDLGAGEHTINMWLVDNSHTPLDPAVETSVTFTIADYTVVANLAELRAGTIDDYYQVTGEIVGTFAQSYRNQKWAQDDTAGIKIDDNDGVITTIYTDEDAIANIKGQLTEYNDLLQFVPTVDPGAPASSSPDNVVTPEEVTLATILADVTAYESELVLIMDATITDIEAGDGTFQTGKNYPFTDASGESILRTNFYGADYIGELLPAIVMDYVCIVGNYNGTAQVTPRDLGDMFHVGTVDQTIAGFRVYPNPTNGVLNITTQNNLEKNIQISDLLGKVVFQTTTNNTSINVADLNNGVYIIQVTEAGLVATRKLVVE